MFMSTKHIIEQDKITLSDLFTDFKISYFICSLKDRKLYRSFTLDFLKNGVKLGVGFKKSKYDKESK